MFNLILFIVWATSCGVAFLFGRNTFQKKKEKPITSAITDKKMSKELENFYSYDGTEQEDISTD